MWSLWATWCPSWWILADDLEKQCIFPKRSQIRFSQNFDIPTDLKTVFLLQVALRECVKQSQSIWCSDSNMNRRPPQKVLTYWTNSASPRSFPWRRFFVCIRHRRVSPARFVVWVSERQQGRRSSYSGTCGLPAAGHFRGGVISWLWGEAAQTARDVGTKQTAEARRFQATLFYG